MFKDGDEDTLFESHETCLCYDIATNNKFWLDNKKASILYTNDKTMFYSE